MPFQENSGVNLEEMPGPLWRSFGLFGDQIERMVALNVAWSIHLLPAIIALAFGSIPLALRVILLIYTGAVLPAMTGWLYGMIAAVCELESLSPELARVVWRKMALPGLRSLGPLLGFLGLLGWLGFTLGSTVIGLLAYLALFFVLASATLWGPYLAYNPDWHALQIFIAALRMLWAQPGLMLLLAIWVLLAGLLGIVSVGGLFLAVPVIIGLLQTLMFLKLARPEKEFLQDV